MILREQLIAEKFNLKVTAVENTLKLLEEGSTIPFISRYRKELTGGLDEVQIDEISKEALKIAELLKRKNSIINTIDDQGKLTLELKKRIEECVNLVELEDIYLPYKPRRRTRADIARENGLENLAKTLITQNSDNVELEARKFINDSINDTTEALKGACDIIAEWISEDIKARNCVRKAFSQSAVIKSKLIKNREEEGEKYKDYFDWSELLRRCPSHRLLAIRRGEKEGFLKVSVTPTDDIMVLDNLKDLFVKGRNKSSELVVEAVEDSYKRLLKASIEREFSNLSRERAEKEAIRVFVNNLRQLLMAPPLGRKRVLAIDPGYRTGCKIVCLDAQGNLIHNTTIYPHPPRNEFGTSVKKIRQLVEQYNIEAISVGNGTAGRETERLVTSIGFDRKVKVFMVSEDGASIYSASKLAREEFPDYDVTVRGAVSIGRRLMDPLAELIKIDPKSLGIGQYQYDVNQTELKKSLDMTVTSCVNQVGVNLNTASVQLLTYVSGVGESLAENIVEYRKINGAFSDRDELMQVPRLGAKAFEQSAGFLRIPDGANPLDNTAVHPESYSVVEKIACDAGCTIQELIGNSELRKSIILADYVTESIGIPTLEDIMSELDKPGRDPRKKIEFFSFDSSIKSIEDLKIGMELPGIVTNITNFGCFVDIGIKENGLVHISQMSDSFVKDPLSVVSVHQHIRVKVINVDLSRNRVALSMKGLS
ncbi:MAG TPA: Tex family protein [Bacteroidaceae bacterium]|nr:Tex family protein [Bacteroidaceae bacterium]